MNINIMITAVLNTLLAVLIYVAEKKSFFGKLSYKKRQLIIGILFGIMAAYASTNIGGLDIGDGTMMNVRDAAPLCAGLIFGGQAGIIAGIIGGLYRYISAIFGLTGTYTQLACSVSTALAGFIAAILRKYMFDNKKPGWLFALGIGMMCEVIHMLMIFFTNANDLSTAFGFVKICSLPMMMYNGFSVGAAVFVISLLNKDRSYAENEKRHISRTFQMWLLICIVTTYVITSLYTYMVQSRMSDTETGSVIQKTLEDVHKDITDASDENLIAKAENIKSEYISSEDKSTEYLQKLSSEYSIKEINIVGLDGIIINSSAAEYIGFNMNSGQQSKEFMEHMGSGVQSYAQAYRAQSFNSTASRKYGAVALDSKSFLQIGYDAEEFQTDISSYVDKVARNRHIGDNGFVIILDRDKNIVSKNSIAPDNISLDTNKLQEDKIFSMDIEGISYLAAYSYAEGYYILGAIPETEARFMRDVSVYLSVFMQILIFSALFGLVYFLIKKLIIDNLREVNQALSKITDGNLDVTVNVRSNEEFASLSDDINSTVSTLKQYIAEASARIDEELEFAKQIQYSAIPSVFPPFPSRKDFDIYAHMNTAKEVGGDFYDFYMTGNSSIAFIIADVSGKGIPAAMFMMKAKTIIKDLAESGMDADEIFTQANEKLCENNDAGMFVTAWMGIVDLETGIMSIANAGHNPPLIRHSDGDFAYENQRTGFILAGMEGIRYRKTQIQLYPGDIVQLYTDGVTEAIDKDEQLYGEDRLLNMLNSIDKKEISSDISCLCRYVKKDIDRFADNVPQFDDITMLSFRLNYLMNEYRLSFIPDKKVNSIVSDFAQKITSKLDVIPKISGKVSIVIDEISSNIINYSNASLAEINYTIENGKLDLLFSDNGIPYNPLDAEAPDITLSAEERGIGGLGIFMVRKMAESVDYKYENGKNILNITIDLNS